MVNKFIPIIIKAVAIVMLAICLILPFFGVSMNIAWKNDFKPPSAPNGINFVFIEATPLGAVLNNLTVGASGELSANPITDPNNELLVVVQPVCTLFLGLSVVSIVLLALAIVFNLLWGRSKLSCILSVFGMLPALLAGGLAFMMTSVFIAALSGMGFTMTGNTGVAEMTETIGMTTYTIVSTVTVNSALSTYLYLGAGIVALVSVFIKSPEKTN